MNKSESKKGKKIALLAVFAMLLFVFAFGGYSFAKYVSRLDEQSDTARVAKWGVKITAGSATNDGFGTHWASGADSTLTVSNAGNMAVSSDTDNIIAPGSTGSINLFEITGDPEVTLAVEFEVTAQDIYLALTEETNYYAYVPVSITLNKNNTPVTEVSTLTDVAEYFTNFNGEYTFQTVTKEIGDSSQQVEVLAKGTGTDMVEFSELIGSYTLTYAWDFEREDGASIHQLTLGSSDTSATIGEVVSGVTFDADVLDTELGNIAALDDDNNSYSETVKNEVEGDAQATMYTVSENNSNLEIELIISVTISQIASTTPATP